MIKFKVNNTLKTEDTDSGHAVEISPYILQFLKETLILKGTLKVLDIGCGQLGLYNIIPTSHEYVGIDITDLKYSNRDFNFIRADLNNNLPIKSSSFNAILIIDVIEHLENSWHIYREMHRVLENGGYIFMTTPAIETRKQVEYFSKNLKFNFFGSPMERCIFRDAFKHINPVFEWQLDQIFETIGIISLRRLKIDCKYGSEILIDISKIYK